MRRNSPFSNIFSLQDPEIDRWIRTGEAPESVASVIDDVRSFYDLGNAGKIVV